MAALHNAVVDVTIKDTFLSRRPRAGSAWVAGATVACPILVSLLCWRDGSVWAGSLPAIADKVLLDREYGRLFTSLAVHAELGHLLGNGLALGVLSFLVYGYYGPLVHPSLTVPLGALVTWLALLTYPLNTALFGASGLVYLMAGFWLVLYLFIERRYTFGKRLFRAIGFALLVLAPASYRPEVSYRSHGLGLLVGAAAGVTYFAVQKRTLRRAEVLEIDEEWD